MTVSVYRYFDAQDCPLYIGITNTRRGRQLEHSHDSIWWNLAARCEIEHFTDREQAAARERDLIRKLKPRFNVTHCQTRIQRLKADQDAMRARWDEESGMTQGLKAELSECGRQLARLSVEKRKKQAGKSVQNG